MAGGWLTRGIPEDKGRSPWMERPLRARGQESYLLDLSGPFGPLILLPGNIPQKNIFMDVYDHVGLGPTVSVEPLRIKANFRRQATEEMTWFSRPPRNWCRLHGPMDKPILASYKKMELITSMRHR